MIPTNEERERGRVDRVYRNKKKIKNGKGGTNTSGSRTDVHTYTQQATPQKEERGVYYRLTPPPTQ